MANWDAGPQPIRWRALSFVIRSSQFGISLACIRRCESDQGLHFQSGLWCNSSISPCEGDGPGANPGILTNWNETTECWGNGVMEHCVAALPVTQHSNTPFGKQMRGERSKEIGLSVRTLLREQFQPRLKDLNAGI